MKLTILGLMAALMSFASAQPASQQPKPVASAEDEAAVRAIVLHWQQSWERFDAAVLQGDYADDADWLNAFGVRIKEAQDRPFCEHSNEAAKRARTQDHLGGAGDPFRAAGCGSGHPRLPYHWS